ncbi:MAG: hypothetical protein JWR22_2842 [Herminiimonas sp.]|nr:hypothetical protein [Herminiimonas sp.]
MQTQDLLYLDFSRNAAGAVIGNLTLGDEPLLSTSHPATLAAAVYAMGASAITMKTADGECKIPFPLTYVTVFGREANLAEDEIVFLRAFGTFSHIAFDAPEDFDIYSEDHLRATVEHLPRQLVVIRPKTPEPKGWAKIFKAKNSFIYYPFC